MANGFEKATHLVNLKELDSVKLEIEANSFRYKKFLQRGFVISCSHSFTENEVWCNRQERSFGYTQEDMSYL